MSYRIAPSRPLAQEVCRIARSQIAEALTILESGRDRRGGNIHDARKRFKRLRGLYRLASGLDADLFRREERRIRDIAKDLSVTRDAAAIVEALDRLSGEAVTPAEIDRLVTLRRGLVARRDRIAARRTATARAIERAIVNLGESRMALDGIREVDVEEAAEILSSGMEKTYGRGAKSFAKARTRGRDEDFHDLRKSVKYHEMHMRLLQDAWPEPYDSRQALAETLGERLGELHDVPVLKQIVEEEEIGGKPERAWLERVLRRNKKGLEDDCLDSAASLFATSPDAMAREVGFRYAEGEAVAAS